MIDLVFHEPQIPPNTGNAMRLSANTGARLHLVEPLGFRMDDASLRRAGLDYRDQASVTVHADWAALRLTMAGRRMFALTSRGTQSLYDTQLGRDPVLVLGTERSGLPPEVLADFPAEQRLRLPMVAGSRSLNLANAAAASLYEAWRQSGFEGSL